MALCGAQAAWAADLAGVRIGVTSKTESRVVIDVTAPTPYSVAGPAADGRSYTFDFPELSISGLKSLEGQGAGLIAGYAWAGAERGSRLTIRLGVAGGLKANFELAASKAAPNHRIVLDFVDRPVLAPVTAATAPAAAAPYEDLTEVLKAVAPPAPASVTAEPPASRDVEAALGPVRARMRVIVIDPGHGGADPGAHSSGGVQEKTVTLAAAKTLSDILKKRGRYQIVLTRADDTRLVLEQRAKIARDAGADLFISLHADANDDVDVRGGSIYTLSEGGTARAAREAQSSGNYRNVYGEDLDQHAPDLSPILYDLAQKTTLTRSARFADQLLRHVKGATPLLNNSHRVADLRVLLSPDVPAVLFELAFISNDLDAANLTSPTWRTKTMTAVADAIDAYFALPPEAGQAVGAASGR